MPHQEEAPEPVRVAVLGAGWVSREVWLPLLQEHPVFEVSAVVDADRAAADEAVKDGDAVVLGRFEDLDRSVADAAIVALPNHLHHDSAAALMRQGLPVFVEKPVSRTLAEARNLAEISWDASQGGREARLLSWSAARHRVDIHHLRSLLPVLGQLRAMDLHWVRAAGIPQRTGWFTDRRLAGGGALLDLGWHLLDVGLDLLGWPEVEQVAGTRSGDWMHRAEGVADWRGPAAGPGPQPSTARSVEDTVRALLVTTDGVAIGLETRWASHATRDSTTVRIEGTGGVLTLRTTFGFSPHRTPSRLSLMRNGHEQEIPLPADPVGAEYRRQVGELAQVLGRPREDGQHARAEDEVLAVADVIERVYTAAAAHRTGPSAHR